MKIGIGDFFSFSFLSLSLSLFSLLLRALIPPSHFSCFRDFPKREHHAAVRSPLRVSIESARVSENHENMKTSIGDFFSFFFLSLSLSLFSLLLRALIPPSHFSCFRDFLKREHHAALRSPLRVSIESARVSENHENMKTSIGDFFSFFFLSLSLSLFSLSSVL